MPCVYVPKGQVHTAAVCGILVLEAARSESTRVAGENTIRGTRTRFIRPKPKLGKCGRRSAAGYDSKNDQSSQCARPWDPGKNAEDNGFFFVLCAISTLLTPPEGNLE